MIKINSAPVSRRTWCPTAAAETSVHTNHVAVGFRYWRLGHDRSFASGARAWQRWPRADLLGVNTPGIVARSLRGYDIAGRAHRVRARSEGSAFRSNSGSNGFDRICLTSDRNSPPHMASAVAVQGRRRLGRQPHSARLQRIGFARTAEPGTATRYWWPSAPVTTM